MYSSRRQEVPSNSAAEMRVDSLQRIQKTGIINVGYGGFPPYTIVDLSAKSGEPVTGLAIDIIKEIAARHEPPLKIKWHNLNWETMRLDMTSGRIDVLADAVYHTVARASQFGMSTPYSFFGIAAAVVAKDDERFNTFSDLDRSDITIAVAEGWTSTKFAKAHLSKPSWKEIIVGESAFTQLDHVMSGRADVAIQDVPTVLQYVQAHKNVVKALWVKNPPAMVPAGFATRIEDTRLLRFLDTSLQVLAIDGTIATIDKKWQGLGHYPQMNLIPGTGLKN